MPGIAPPPLGSPQDVFAEKCASCHALQPGAPDGTGPNLADSLADQDEKYTREQIINPDSVIFDGFPPGVMPENFEQEIPGKNLDALVDYILQAAQGGGGGGS